MKAERPAERVLATDVQAEGAREDGVSTELTTAHKLLWETDDVQIGIWDAGPGVDTDVESEEVFLVLSGAGTVSFDDGAVVDLVPGRLVRLRAGDRTRWDITQRLRKLYVFLS